MSLPRSFASVFVALACLLGCEQPVQPCGGGTTSSTAGCFMSWECGREGQFSLTCVAATGEPADAMGSDAGAGSIGRWICTCRVVRGGELLPERTFEPASCPLTGNETSDTTTADALCGWRIGANRRDAP